MKSAKFTCIVFTMLFLALAYASGWFVYRRVPTGEAAFWGGVIGGILLILTLAWLIAIPDRIFEWLQVLRALLGGEPRDGKTNAIIGTLRGQGDLRAPFSHERCVLYEYEATATRKTGNSTSFYDVYEGFAMVPLFIEHGVERTRILSKPKIAKLEKTEPFLQRAADFVKDANFEPAPEKIPEEQDLTHTDGRLRYDYKREPEMDIMQCALKETILRGDQSVCAIGTYTTDRRALTGDVALRFGTHFGIQAAWRVVNAFIGAVIFGAFAIAAAAIFCVNFPLEAVEASKPEWKLQWWEIDLERFIEKRLRTPMIEAGVLTMPGFYLRDVCDGCATGTLQINDRVIELKHARYAGGRAVHLSAKPGDRDGVTLEGRDSVTLTIDGKSAPVPASWLQRGDVETSLGSEGEYAGRVTVIAPDGWIRCRAYFKTQVDENAWLQKR